MKKNRMKITLFLSLLLIASLLLLACGDIEARNNSDDNGKNKTTQGAKATNAPNDDNNNKIKDPFSNNTPSDPTPTEAGKDDPTPTEPPKDSDFQDPEDNKKEYSTANSIWRVYRMVDGYDDMERFLYLDINFDKGYVQFHHSYDGPNTYSSTKWPIKDGIMYVQTFDGGGEPGVGEVYLQYSKNRIRLYYVDEKGNVDYESYSEFRLESEDVIKR
jgi:hypothetical protein